MRVERCFAFVDLTGFTAFMEHHGDERTVEILTAFRGRTREIAARRGVRVTKWLGDGAMFSSADTAGVIALVLELADRVVTSVPLGLRAGLAHGAVIMFEGDDYIGRPANVAARLCDVARPGQVLATREVASAAPRWVTCEPVGPVPLPGIDRPPDVHDLCITGGQTAQNTVIDPCCGLRLPASSGLDTRFGADGTVQRFCSTACASTWEQNERFRQAAVGPTAADPLS